MKTIFMRISVFLCVLLVGCSQEYIERTDAWLREYREQDVPPRDRIGPADEYGWGGQWQSMHTFGCTGFGQIPVHH